MSVKALDGVELNALAGRWSVLDESDFVSGFSTAQAMTDIPGVDGSMMGASTMVVPEKTIVLSVVADDDDSLRTTVTMLLGLLRNGKTLTRTPDANPQSITCAFKESQPVEYWPGHAIITATLRLPGVYWRSASADWTRTNPANGTLYEVATLANSSAPVDDALILVTGPIAQPNVTVASGGSVSVGITLAAGEKALIDCAAWTVRRGTGVTFAGGGSLTSGNLITSGGPYLLRLVPQMRGTDPAATWVRVSLSGSGQTSSTAIAVRARPASVA